VNGVVSGKIFTGNIQKHPETSCFFSIKHGGFLQMFHDFPFFPSPGFRPQQIPQRRSALRKSECQMISDDHKINPFYGNLESMDLKWLEYVGVYRWQPPWIVVDHDASSRLWLSIIFNSCGPRLRLALHHSIKDNYMW
jgi:hypothetical protein